MLSAGLKPRGGFVWLVETVPIYHSYAQRTVRRIPPLWLAHVLAKDWRSPCPSPQDFVCLARGFSPAVCTSHIEFRRNLWYYL